MPTAEEDELVRRARNGAATEEEDGAALLLYKPIKRETAFEVVPAAEAAREVTEEVEVFGSS